jgi:hypothetical protein
MARLTLQLFGSGRPLRSVGVQVLAVRKGLQSELSETGGKAYQFRLSCKGHLVATCAELAVRRGKILLVTVVACRVARKPWSGFVVRPLVADAAVELLVLGAVVVERRHAFNYGGVYRRDLRLWSRRSRRGWRRGRTVCVVGLLRIAASQRSDEKSRGQSNDHQFELLRPVLSHLHEASS